MQSSRDVILQVPDLDAAAKFYENVMGFSVFERSADILGFDTGSFRLFIERGAAPGPVFEFHDADAIDAKARLVEAGCTVMDEDELIPRCYLRDPFGLTFNLAGLR